MIKGQDISTLMTINDTTSGRLSVWVMVIMLILLYIIYLFVYQKLEQYRYHKLVELRDQLESALIRHELKQDTSQAVGMASKNEEVYGKKPMSPALDEEDQEAMELFESLKSKKGR